MNVAELTSNRGVPVSGSADLRKLREAVGKTIGQVFFGTLLSEMRKSNLKGTFGHGGRGEEVFAAQLHGMLAERAGETGGGNLQRAMLRVLEKQQQRISRSRLNVQG